jgi:hypothetical protein
VTFLQLSPMVGKAMGTRHRSIRLCEDDAWLPPFRNIAAFLESYRSVLALSGVESRPMGGERNLSRFIRIEVIPPSTTSLHIESAPVTQLSQSTNERAPKLFYAASNSTACVGRRLKGQGSRFWLDEVVR